MTIMKLALGLAATVVGVGVLSAPGMAQVVETFYFCTDDGTWGTDETKSYMSFDESTCSDAAADGTTSDNHVVVIYNISG